MTNLKALEAYLEVATLGSVTAAAKRLNMSQPSVSRLIQELERDLQLSLFERVGQRLVLTTQGLLLRDDVDRALSGIAEVQERARSLSDVELQPLRLSSVSSIATGLLPNAWNSLELAERGQLISVTENPDQVRNAVKSGSVDLGASSLPLEHRDLTMQWFGSAPCVLAVRDDDSLVKEVGPIDLAALRGRTMIAMSNNRGLPSRIRRALRENGLDEPSVLTNSTMNALNFVRAGSGISIIEPVTLAGAAMPGIRTLPISASILYCFGIVTPSAAQPAERIDALVDALRVEAESRLSDFITYEPEMHQELLVKLSLLEDRS